MDPYIAQLYRALESKFGIVVSHENPQSARSQYYYRRKKHGDPSLDSISITILQDNPNQIYLVKPWQSEKIDQSNEPMSGSSPTTTTGSSEPTEIT